MKYLKQLREVFLVASAFLIIPSISYSLDISFRDSFDIIFGSDGILSYLQDPYVAYVIVLIIFWKLIQAILNVALSKAGPISEHSGKISGLIALIVVLGIFYNIPPGSSEFVSILSTIGKYGLLIIALVIFITVFRFIKKLWDNYRSTKWAIAIALLIVLLFFIPLGSLVGMAISGIYTIIYLVAGLFIVSFLMALFQGKPGQSYINKETKRLDKDIKREGKEERTIEEEDREELEEDKEADELEREEEKDYNNLTQLEVRINRVLNFLYKQDRKYSDNNLIQSYLPSLYGLIRKTIRIIEEGTKNFIAFNKHNASDYKIKKKVFNKFLKDFHDYHYNLKLLESAENVPKRLEKKAEENVNKFIELHKKEIMNLEDEIEIIEKIIKILKHLIKFKEKQERIILREIKRGVDKNKIRHLVILQHYVINLFRLSANAMDEWFSIQSEKEQIDKEIIKEESN